MIMNSVLSLMSSVWKNWLPPKKITISEWAEENVIISAEYGMEPGPYSCSRAPYQKEIMDTFGDPDIERVTIKSSAQVGKSQLLLNIIGYFSAIDPCPILVMNPTIKLSEAFSKDRVTPFFRDTKALSKLMKDNKSKESGNTILTKRLNNKGLVTLLGSNAEHDLASRTIRLLLADEIDDYEIGDQGNPLDVAIARTSNYWNRKILMVSTPKKEEDHSNIEKAYNRGDKREYFVPCPHCGKYQTLSWKHDGKMMLEMEKEGDVQTTFYRCQYCEGKITEKHKHKMLLKGEWRATEPNPKDKGHASFYINTLYSPFYRFSQVMDDFIKAKSEGMEGLKAFYNLRVGWVWKEDAAMRVSVDDLLMRAEEYPAEIPLEVGALTAGVDFQGDRIEVTVLGHGKWKQKWVVAHHVYYGNVSDLTHECWKRLDELLDHEFRHESGQYMKILAAFLDAGFLQDTIFTFTKARFHRLIFASRGSSKGASFKDKVSAKPVNNNKVGAYMYWLGSNSLKAEVYSNVRVLDPNQVGYIHFNEKFCNEEYFKQFMSERYYPELKKYDKKIKGSKNETLDCFCYALAAYEAQNLPDIERRVDVLYDYWKNNTKDEIQEVKSMQLESQYNTQLPNTIENIIQNTPMQHQNTPEQQQNRQQNTIRKRFVSPVLH